jgi:hypothetical protein
MSTPGRLDLLGEPFHEPVDRNDVVAVVLERRRNQGKPHLPLRREEVHVIVVHGSGKRRALLFEVRNQVTQARGVEHRARQFVGTRLPRLVENRDGQRFAARGLLQSATDEAPPTSRLVRLRR